MNLQGAKELLESRGHNVYYIALYGSQNYGLDTAVSDFDYKAIVIPTLDDVITETKPFSSVYEFEGGQIDVKDIRSYVDSVVKCNINFLEILGTEYYIGDTALREYFLPLQKEMGQLFIKACFGMIMEKFTALRHPYPSIVHKIEKFGYDPKQLHHIVRLRILMERYVSGDIGDYSHKFTEQKALVDIKNGTYHNKEVDGVAEDNIALAKSIRDNYTQEMKFDAKKSIVSKSKEIIKQYIRNEILGQNSLQ